MSDRVARSASVATARTGCLLVAGASQGAIIGSRVNRSASASNSHATRSISFDSTRLRNGAPRALSGDSGGTAHARSKEQAILYHDIVLAGLPQAPRARWETYMRTATKLLNCSFCGKNQKQVKKLIAGPNVYICDECVDLCNEIIEKELAEGSEYRSKLMRKWEASGQGRAVLTVLDARGVAAPEAIREQILTCTDQTQLDTWLHRAVTATTADDVIRP